MGERKGGPQAVSSIVQLVVGGVLFWVSRSALTVERQLTLSPSEEGQWIMTWLDDGTAFTEALL